MATFGSVLYNPLPSYKSHVLRADILTTFGSLWFQKKVTTENTKNVIDIDPVCCNSTSVNSVVSKKITTENTEKSICRYSLMQFHLCKLCGFKKDNHGEHREKYL
jgi:hypothetical protein